MYNFPAEVGEFCVNRVFNPLSHLHGRITQKAGLCCRGDRDDAEDDDHDDDDDDDEEEEMMLEMEMTNDDWGNSGDNGYADYNGWC